MAKEGYARDPDEAKATRRLANSRHKYSELRRLYTLQAQTDGHTLRPWMKALALWCVGQPKFPRPEACHTKANELTKAKLSFTSVKRLLINPVFQAFLQQCEEEVTTHAKAHAETHLVAAVQKHFDAIDDLHANKKWDTLAKFTNPLLDRVWPVKDGPKMPAQIIQIMVGTQGSFAATNAKAPNPIQIQTVEEADAEVT